MSTAGKHKSPYEQWQDGINKAVSDPKWNVYDCDIILAVNEFNSHLAGTSGYRQLEPQFIKAMLWVETGAGNIRWKSNPMQIGNPGDPGLSVLLSGKEGGDVIIPPAWRGRLNASAARTIPSYNIRAGIGYLLMKMANFAIKSIPDAGSTIYEIMVKAGDSLDKISKAQGTTIEVLKKLNPMASVLRPGQVVKYQKASMQKVIVGWKPLTTTTIAHYYNGGGDSLYAKKLDYALALVWRGKAAVCLQ